METPPSSGDSEGEAATCCWDCEDYVRPDRDLSGHAARRAHSFNSPCVCSNSVISQHARVCVCVWDVSDLCVFRQL